MQGRVDLKTAGDAALAGNVVDYVRDDLGGGFGGRFGQELLVRAGGCFQRGGRSGFGYCYRVLDTGDRTEPGELAAAAEVGQVVPPVDVQRVADRCGDP